MLWTDVGPHFVDLEDCRMGPATPDPWMMLSCNRSERALQLATPREGDATFHALDPRELALIEPLCALGMIHQRRLALVPLGRPHVPLALPWFGTPQYWQDHVGSLEVQLAAGASGSPAGWCWRPPVV